MRAGGAGGGCGITPASTEPTRLPGSFKTEQTSWGPMVVSIHGLAASSKDRTYWQFLSGADALQEGGQCGAGDTTRGDVVAQPHACPSTTGVGSYQPHNREHIEAVFSTY